LLSILADLSKEQLFGSGYAGLGLMYIDGLGVLQNRRKGVDLVREAAQMGVPFAQVMLGTMYEEGIGVAHDYTKAEKWLGLAAAQSYPGAKENLVRMHERKETAARIDVKPLTSQQVHELSALVGRFSTRRLTHN